MSDTEQTVHASMLVDLVPIKALTPDHCQELAEKSEFVKLEKGKPLFREGDTANRVIYLIRGEVELTSSKGSRRIVVGGTKAAKLPLEQSQVHQFTATTRTEASFVKVDANLLDIMLTWQQSGGYEVQDLDSGGGISDEDWMSRILQAKVFHGIPPANIQTIFMKMETCHYGKGEAVIKQGDDDEYFYIIREGVCDVVRKTRKNPDGVRLAHLGVGDNFGEESLIAGGRRNASVVMRSNGVLLRLSKTDFLSLLSEPLLKTLSYPDAKSIAGDGGVWIDVRLPQEYQSRHIHKSLNIPLPILRVKLNKLDQARRYIVYCDTGRRSSTATYILSQNGFDASVLQDGLQNVDPHDLSSKN